MKPRQWMVGTAIVIAIVLGMFVGGWLFSSPAEEKKDKAPVAHEHDSEGEGEAKDGEAATIWTCSMHPNVQLPEPGKCPICGMDLIPVAAGGGGAPRVSMSKEAAELARLRTVAVERRDVAVDLSVVGKVETDETAVARIAARFGGRIERMFVDYTGTSVKKGDHLFELYSPELLVAQEELIQAEKALARLPASTSATLRGSLERTAEAARDKLRLWELQPWQIRRIAKRKKPTRVVTIYAPIGGIVTHKAAVEGSYVKTGSPIYTIADLSRIWVVLDAYESDVQWLRWGQDVTFEVAAFPGRHFKGEVSFISPTMDPKTRTVEVRLNVDNPDRALKPGMFVRSTLKVPVAGGGIDATALKGKYVSPMHPEVVSDEPGRCTVCGMKLVPAEEHWLVGPALKSAKGGQAQKPLAIPATAPILTGKRAVVFVEQEGADEPTYLLREVTLGPRAGDWYVVADGLMEGERVVAEGAFKLDSALQIRGDHSSMNLPPSEEGGDDGQAEGPSVFDEVTRLLHEAHEALEAGHGDHLKMVAGKLAERAQDETALHTLRGPARWLGEVAGDAKARTYAWNLLARSAARIAKLPGAKAPHLHEVAFSPAFDKALGEAAKAAVETSKALAADDLEGAKTSAKALSRAIARLGAAKAPVAPELAAGAEAIAKAEDLDGLRREYLRVNSILVPLVLTHREAIDSRLQVSYCPMASDNAGAYWLEPVGELANAYFGEQMLRCGNVEATYE